MRIRSLTLLSSLLLLASPVVSAAPKLSSKLPTQVMRSAELRLSPVSLGAIRLTSEAPQLLVELTRAPNSRAELLHAVTELEASGVRVVRAGGQPLAYHQFVVVTADPNALGQVALLKSVKRVLPALRPGLPSLDRSAALLGLAGARGSRPAAGALTGSGMVLADVDTLADVFHPDFFRGDAGYFDWTDVNDNGTFDVGVDAVDLNRNGEADGTEIAQPLRASPINISSGDEAGGVHITAFDPSVDWVFLDENADKQRNHGADAGFAEDVPAFGEPLFVPDDVNGDGVIGPAERFVRLGTSKFRKLYAKVNYQGIQHDHIYERGVDMGQAPIDLTHGVYGYADALHATGVLSIAAGGVPLPSRRWVGMAPDADLVLAFGISNSVTAPVIWALSQEPDVLLHEASVWTSMEMDGSDAWSKLIDSSSAAGVINICPTGNIGGARKHAVVDVAATASGEMQFNVPADTQSVELTMHVRGGTDVTLSLREPSGTVHPLSATANLDAGGKLYSYGDDVSDGGTRVFYNYLISPGGGDYVVEIQGDPGATATVHGFVADEAGFSLNTAWDAAIATDSSTAAVPSVASTCVGVGAVPSHLSNEGDWARAGDEAQGEIREYSGRGPRIDGEQVLDVAAPDNPWVAAPEGDIFPQYPGYSVIPHGGEMIFGGTSGAGPHAAGVAVLLAQAGQTGAAAIEALRSGAEVDALTGSVPNADYGYGRLSAAGSFGVPVDAAAPKIELSAKPAGAAPGETVTVTPVVTGSGITLRWDDGYDGSWDTELGAADARDFVQANEPLRLKVQAWNSNGRIAEAVLLVPLEPMNGVGGAGGSGGSAGGGAAGTSNASGGASGGGEDGGCGCATPGHSNSSGSAWLALGGLAYLVRRRRKSKSPSAR
ncbi:MAG: S8 family serine peptidase [Polyangiaceae bacterium]